MTKTLFNENYSFNDEGEKLDKEIMECLSPLFDKYIDKGYSIKEIAVVMYNTIGFMQSSKIIEEREKRVVENNEM